MDDATIPDVIDGSGNKVVVELAHPAKSKGTLCAVETLAGPAPIPILGPSSSVTVADVPQPPPSPNTPTATTDVDKLLFVGGVDVSAGASTNAGSRFGLDIDFDQPLFPLNSRRSVGKQVAAETNVDAPLWLSGYVRLASIAQPGAISSSASITSYVSPAIDTTPNNLVESGEMLISMDFGGRGNAINQTPVSSNQIRSVGTISVGAITPLSSAPTNPPLYVVSLAIYNYYTSSSVNSAMTAIIQSACGTTYSTTTPCYIGFLPQERTSFFRDWSAGFKFKNYYYDKASSQFAFPGTATLTFGQNEYVTGGAMSGFVLHVGAFEPLPPNIAGTLAGYLYVFGSMDAVVRRNIANGGAPQFSLATAPSNIAASATDVALVSVAQPNRDRYRFGVELDLTKLISLMNLNGKI